MNVVGHQHISVHIAIVFDNGLRQLLEVKFVVIFCIEDGISIVSPDNDMLRLAGDNEAG